MTGNGIEGLRDSILALAGASAADLIGIAPTEEFAEQEFGELGQSFGPIQSIIVLAQHIADPVQTVRFHTGETYADSRVGASFGDALLRNAAWLVVEMLRGAGHKAAIPRNMRYGKDGPRHHISYKKAGVVAGLGSFGRNQLLIHPEWGPWMYLRTVVTDVALPPDAPLSFSPCEDCAAPCLEACPTGWLRAATLDREGCGGAALYDRDGQGAVRLSRFGKINCEECMRACPIGVAPPRIGGEARP